ncbi:hypothetical protein CspeluHIS016_0700300 [Cutaneotrichosporon spelunceum]|uniref:Uncharacterized protein n=1 Tax=Cutaneotrichosporon spelunceum TaxID=1672016 RepID=A0AAD3YDB2_9TREE|nr:hypothetical protein CspeluHIS016_0700300 [Cutaneotrichosporon spelunceum]
MDALKKLVSGCKCPEAARTSGQCQCRMQAGGCACKTNKCKCPGCTGRVRPAGRHTSSSSSDEEDDAAMRARKEAKRQQRV